MTEALVLESISKRFGGVQALDGVGLTVHRAEVHALLGHNGSGKSTLIKILSGYHAPEPGGRCWMGGEAVDLPMSPQEARNRGLAFVHQQPGVLASLSVTENLLMGKLAVGGIGHVSWSQEHRRTAQILERWSLSINPKERVGGLRSVEIAMLSIVRAVESIPGLSEHADRTPDSPGLPVASGGVLVLDEATAALTVREVVEVVDMVRRVTDAGVAVIFVSHDIDEVFRIADRITALRDGRVIGTVKLGEVSRPEVVGMIVGGAARAIKDVEREAARTSVPSHGRKTTMALRDYRATDDSEPISFDVRSGEVLGLTGLAGSAARDLPYLIYGAAPWVEAPTGWIELTHSRIALNRMAPWRALREGLVLVPGARLREGGVASLTVFENVSVVLLRRYFAGGRIKFRAMRSHVRSLLDRFNVMPADPTMHFGNLSGGNQQKVVVAKWLEGSPSIVLLVDPTQGVDVGARAEIWATVVELAESGCSVVCASSDSEELATICHRVLVLRQEGGVFAEVTGEEMEKDRITELCLLSGEPAVGAVNAKELEGRGHNDN